MAVVVVVAVVGADRLRRQRRRGRRIRKARCRAGGKRAGGGGRSADGGRRGEKAHAGEPPTLLCALGTTALALALLGGGVDRHSESSNISCGSSSSSNN